MSVAPTLEVGLADGRTARLVMTDRSHGDLAVDQPPHDVDPRRRSIVDAPWTWLRQVHGRSVVRVDAPGDGAGREADAAWTAATRAPLAIQVADCAPVALVAADAVGVAHAGWRGLLDGVLAALADAMRRAGHEPTRAVRGPCIGPAAYEFGTGDLDAMADRFGESVRGRTDWDSPALDMPAAVRAALVDAGIDDIVELPGCTARDDATRWSHRARGDRQRQALVAWIDLP